MSLFPACDSPLTIRSAVRKSGKTEWLVTDPAGRYLRATYNETDAIEFADAWVRGIETIEDGVTGLTVVGTFVQGEGSHDDN